MWLFSVWLVLAVGAVELRGALLRGLVITQEQVAQVQGEGGAAVVGERAGSLTGLGTESDSVVCLGQGGNQVRGGFVAVLVAGQGEVVRLRVLVSISGCSGGGKVSLEDVFNAANLLGVRQGTVICGKRNVAAIQGLVGVLARVVSGGERIAGQQACLVGGEGAARLTQGGQQKFGQERAQGLGGVRDSLLQVFVCLRGGLGVEQGQESHRCHPSSGQSVRGSQ